MKVRFGSETEVQLKLQPLTLGTSQFGQLLTLPFQLFEQQKKKKATSNEIAFVLGQYVKRWCTAGLTGITATVNLLSAHADILLKAGPPHTMDIVVSRDFIYAGVEIAIPRPFVEFG